MVLFELVLMGVFVIIAGILIVWLYKDVQSEVKKNENQEKTGKFEWHYTKLLLSYKIKVLKDEIKKRKVSMQELNEIMNEALGTKTNTKHVLDTVEEEVKGEVKKASPKIPGGE